MTEARPSTVSSQPVARPAAGPAVRETGQGTWFRLADGPGSLLRLPPGADADAVRRLRRLGLPGLMPIATVLEDGGRVWVATPVPTGPTVDDLLDGGCALGLGPGDAAAVLSAVGRTLRALHARGLGHGALDPVEVVVAPDGAPLLVALTGRTGQRDRDRAAWARLAWALADAWCGADPAVAGDLRGCADLAEAVGLGAALGALPFATEGEARRRAVRSWTAGAALVPRPGRLVGLSADPGVRWQGAGRPSYRAYSGRPATPPAGVWAVEKPGEPSWTGH